jgi:hypothetical protein
VGEQEVAWVVRDANGKPVPASWPPALQQILTQPAESLALK